MTGWWGLPLALFALGSSARAQLDIPSVVELDWIGLVDAETFGLEFPRSATRNSQRAFVSGTRVPSAHFVLGLDADGGDELWRMESSHPIGLQLAASDTSEFVFATGFDSVAPPTQRATVQAMSVSTGELIWEQTFNSGIGQVFVQAPRAIALSPDGTRVYVAGSENEVVGGELLGFATLGCYLTADGSLQWIQRQTPMASQLLAYEQVAVSTDGSAVFASGGDGLGQGGTAYLSAYEAQSGAVLYQSPVAAGPVRDLVLSPGNQRAAIATDPTSFGDNVFVFDLPTGTPLWSVRLGDQAMDCSYGGNASHLLVHSIQDGVLPGSQQNELVTWCLSGLDGSTLWSEPFDAPWGNPGGIDIQPGENSRTLFVDAGDQRVVTAASRGPEGGPVDVHVVSYDLLNGALVWEESFDISQAHEDQSLRTLIGMEGSGQILLVGDDATEADPQGLSVRALNSDDGAQLWRYTWNLSSSASNVPVDLAESVLGDRLFLLDRLNPGSYLLVNLTSEDGDELWRTNLDFPESTDVEATCQVIPSGSGDSVFVHLAGSTISRVFGLDAVTGEVLWDAQTGALEDPRFMFQAMALAPDDSMLFVGGDASGTLGGLELVALDPTDGDELWSTELPSSTAKELFGGLRFEPESGNVYIAGTEAVFIGAPAGADSNLVWYALEGDNGDLVYRGVFEGAPATTPSFEQAMSFELAPDLLTATVFGRVDGPNGPMILATFGVQKGQLLWSQVVPGPATAGVEPRDAVHAAGGGVLVVGSRVGPVQAPAEDDIVVTGYVAGLGVPLWSRTFDFGSGDVLGELIVGKDDLTVYGIGTRGLGTAVTDELHVFALDALTGATLWTASYDSPVQGFGFDDSGHDLLVDPNDLALFGAGTVWNGEQLADTIVFRFGLPSLYASPIALSLGSGGAQSLTLRATPEQAGDLYLVLGSASGTAPAVGIDGLELPLVPDVYTSLSVSSAGTGIFAGTLGVLDPLGRGAAEIRLPPGTSLALAGTTLHHAFLVVDLDGTLGVSLISNAEPLFLVP